MDEAEAVGDIFKTAFTLFRCCHDIYDQKAVDEQEIVLLGTFKHVAYRQTVISVIFFYPDANIKAFMRFYRKHFPHSTVLPKMHFLEEHTVAFLKKWQVGFGLLGEQGAESIHKHLTLTLTLTLTASQRPKPKKRKITETLA